jgi:hypothetical protein
MYGFYGFHGFVRIFLGTNWGLSKKIKKSVSIGEIRKIRTSIRLVIFPSRNG